MGGRGHTDRRPTPSSARSGVTLGTGPDDGDWITEGTPMPDVCPPC